MRGSARRTVLVLGAACAPLLAVALLAPRLAVLAVVAAVVAALLPVVALALLARWAGG